MLLAKNNKILLIHKTNLKRSLKIPEKNKQVIFGYRQEAPAGPLQNSRNTEKADGLFCLPRVEEGPTKAFSGLQMGKPSANRIRNHQTGKPSANRLCGSLTVEAALVFPIFLFAMILTLYFFRVIQVSSMTYGALSAVAGDLSIEAEEDSGTLLMAASFYQKLLSEEFPFSYISGSAAGFSWEGTSLDETYVTLCLQYRCKLPVTFFQVGNIKISQQVKVRKWQGNDGEGTEGDSETWVYRTTNGTVYHTTKSCRYLKLTISTMERSADKQKGYEACNLCGTLTTLYSYCYVTEDGSKYHTSLGCSGLKRTIYMVKLSQVGELTACSRCGG